MKNNSKTPTLDLIEQDISFKEIFRETTREDLYVHPGFVEDLEDLLCDDLTPVIEVNETPLNLFLSKLKDIKEKQSRLQ